MYFVFLSLFHAVSATRSMVVFFMFSVYVCVCVSVCDLLLISNVIFSLHCDVLLLYDLDKHTDYHDL